MAMLEVKDLEVSYGLIRAIRGVSFEVNEGEIVALIGANGAGKTTIMHAVAGLIPQAGGTGFFPGKTLRPFRHIRWFPWEWRRFRRGGGSSRS